MPTACILCASCVPQARRKQEDAARAAAEESLRVATAGEDATALSTAIAEFKQLCINTPVGTLPPLPPLPPPPPPPPLTTTGAGDRGGSSVAGSALLDAAEAQLKLLTSPEHVKAKEAEQRVTAAERRLGSLTPAQRAFLLGKKK